MASHPADQPYHLSFIFLGVIPSSSPCLFRLEVTLDRHNFYRVLAIASFTFARRIIILPWIKLFSASLAKFQLPKDKLQLAIVTPRHNDGMAAASGLCLHEKSQK